jgi:hypothetical protein
MKDSLADPAALVIVIWLIALALTCYSNNRIISDQHSRIVQLETAMKIHHVDVPPEIRK